jgi:hypothetical protein
MNHQTTVVGDDLVGAMVPLLFAKAIARFPLILLLARELLG